MTSASLVTLYRTIVEFLKFCKEKNLKLKTSNFSEQVEFAGATLTPELVQGEQVVNIPKDGHINAFRNLKMPETKSDVSSYCEMLASLQAWTTSVSLIIPLF